MTGERGHYELAAGHNASLYVQTLERFASATGLLSEQVWDEPSRPEVKMEFGHPTGSARPLMWAHAEYVKLLRSVRDRRVFDVVPEAYARYCGSRRPSMKLEIWKPNRQVSHVAAGSTLRIQVPRPFRLHWTSDEWQATNDRIATATRLETYYVDLPTDRSTQASIKFTFFWTDSDAWEGRDYTVAVSSRA